MTQCLNDKKRVSIHAPTQGATVVGIKHVIFEIVSIHAPTQGATWEPGVFKEGDVSFNPRSHAGSDK